MKIFSDVLPDEWVIREISERDYGIDLYVEICEKNCITGKLLSIQLKGSENIHYDKTKNFITYYNVKSSTFNYWNQLPVPIFFVYVDTSTKDCFFCDVKKYIREHYLSFKKETLANIKIPATNKLTKETSELILNHFYLIESDRHKRDMLITNFCMSVVRNVDLLWDHIGKDCFLYIEGEDELRIYMLINELMYLSAIFSVSWKCPSLKDVIEEGQKKYGTYGLLYEGEMTNYGKQLLSIMKKLSSKIQRNVMEEEGDYWRLKNPFVYRYLEENILEELIIGI